MFLSLRPVTSRSSHEGMETRLKGLHIHFVSPDCLAHVSCTHHSLLPSHPLNNTYQSSFLVQVFIRTRIVGDLPWFSRELSSKKLFSLPLFYDLGRASNYCLLVPAALLGYRILLEASPSPARKQVLAEHHVGVTN